MEEWIQSNHSPEQLILSEERKQIRKLSNRCGFVMIILLISLYTLSFGLGFAGTSLWRLLPTEFTSLFSFEDVANLMIYLFFYMVMHPILIFYCNSRSGTKLSEYLRFPRLPGKSVAKLVLMGLGVVWASGKAGGWVYEGINTILKTLFGIEMKSVDMTMEPNLISITLLILSTVILAPLFEELLARCALLGTLSSHGGVFAAIATGVMFGFMHTNFQQIFFATAMGIYTSFVVYRTRSLWPSILLHGIVNGISALQVIALSFTVFDTETLNTTTLLDMDPYTLLMQLGLVGIVAFLSLLLMVFGIIGLVALIKEIIRNPQEFTLPEEQKAIGLRTREKCKIFFTSPAVIVFFSLSILFSAMNAFVF